MRFSYRPSIFSLLSCLILFSNPLSAQDPVLVEKNDPGGFYGFWEFQEPAGDTCIVIIKRGGRLSCFWAGTAAKAIQKGSWERTETTLTARWDAGNIDVFRMLGDNAIERDSYPEGTNLLQKPVLTIRGVRIDSRVPGSLTIKNEGPRPITEEAPDPQAAPAIPLNNAYVGFWKMKQSTGIFGIGGGEPYFYLQLSRDGNAQVALRDWEGDNGVTGKWKIDGDRIIISWPNNRRDALQPKKEGGFILGTYKPKDSLESKPRDPTEAVKVTSADAERFFQAGNFARLTVLDIRGTWSPKEPTGQSEYISIEGWGNAYRFPAKDGGGGTDPGKWRLLTDRVIITWIDGSKDVIRISFPDFVQDSFGADQTLTDTPVRTVGVILTSKE